MRYQMQYIEDGGKIYDGGDWEIKETAKTVTFNQTREPFFDSNCPHKMRLPKSNRSPHCLEVYDDKFVVYPYRSGVPHIFAPLK